MLPAAILFTVLALAIFALGLWAGREIYRPRPDFRRYELPPHSRRL